MAPLQILAAATIILASGLSSSSLATAQLPTSSPEKTGQTGISVFQLPKLKQNQRNVLVYFRTGQYQAAKKLLNDLIIEFPELSKLRLGLAVALIKQGKRDTAIEQLTLALNSGLGDDRKLNAQQVAVKIQKSPRFASLMIQAAYTVGTNERVQNQEPSLIASGVAEVSDANTSFDARLNLLKSFFKLSTKPAKTPVILNGDGPAATHLNGLYAKGLAAGNYGDLYDNRDKDHSRLPQPVLPQISRITYSNAASSAGQHYGLNGRLLFNLPTIGNSSTALANGRDWRSQARLALTNPGSPAFLYLQYINNQLYVYPEHRDHDPRYGDLLTANTPYMLISQGSSGSDQPFLRALGAILGAFKPAVKSQLTASKLLMPTVQMVFRKGLKTVLNDADYLSAKAHPSVFRATDIDLPRMIGIANNVKFDELPPLPRLRVLSESAPLKGIEVYSPNPSEKLFDTPYAISRIIRSTARDKLMTLSVTPWPAGDSKKIDYQWVVLRGDPRRITLKPTNENGSRVELAVPWHDRRPIAENTAIMTDRVDIAVFAKRGEIYSAPSFISFLYPGHQHRTYDRSGKIVRIDYNEPSHVSRYVDPRLFYRRNWRDNYLYDEKDRLLGWRRVRSSGTQIFTRHGALATEFDHQNRPVKAAIVTYKIKPNAKRISDITQVKTEQTISYTYSDDNDRYGR